MTIPSTVSFAVLFKTYRVLAGFSTLSNLADTLADEGYTADISILSRWQTGDRTPSDRETVLLLLKLFIKRGAVSTTDAANQILESVGMGYLTQHESKALLPHTLPLSWNTGDELVSDAPIIISSLRKQGDISLALRLSSFFEQKLVSNHNHLASTQLKLLTEIYSNWARTLSDIAWSPQAVDQFSYLSRKALTMAESLRLSESISMNMLNLGGSKYVLGNWTQSKDILLSAIPAATDITKIEMLILLILDVSHLKDRALFNYLRPQAEELSASIREHNSYHADALLEAVARGLALMGEIDESRQVSQQILFPQVRPFFESEMIKHDLITFLGEARKGKLVDGRYIKKLSDKSQVPQLKVFSRHQHQISTLLQEIKALQPRSF